MVAGWVQLHPLAGLCNTMVDESCSQIESRGSDGHLPVI